MKVKELIELLKKQDQDKDVYIQQGEEPDYMQAQNIRETQLINWEYEFDASGANDDLIDVVVIEYN